jgi:hypothetical protein
MAAIGNLKLPSQNSTQPDSIPKQERQNWLSSYVLLAGAAVVIANIAAFGAFKTDPTDSPNHCWAYWTAKDWQAAQKSERKPNTVFFGSSLMVAVVNDGDSSFLQQPLDAVKNHRSKYFETYAARLLGKPVSTHSFAIGGQMASDACALFRALPAKGEGRPLLVWGVAPRDLVDSSFSDPASTETVRYLDKVSYPQDVLPESKRVWKQIERQIERSIYLYGKRADFQIVERNLAENIIEKTLGTTFDTIKAPQPLLKIAMAEQPEENSPGQWIVSPYSQKAAKHALWADNSKEYCARYQPFRPKVFNSQSKYMDKLLQQAHEMGFSVILVNMPLTKQNTDLLPAGIYDKYLNRVRELAQKNDAQFVDFNRPGVFSKEDFCDPVHLHGLGAQKFMRKVAEQVGNLCQSKALAGKAQPL